MMTWTWLFILDDKMFCSLTSVEYDWRKRRKIKRFIRVIKVELQHRMKGDHFNYSKKTLSCFLSQDISMWVIMYSAESVKERQNNKEYLYLYIKPIDFDIQILSAFSYGSWQNIKKKTSIQKWVKLFNQIGLIFTFQLRHCDKLGIIRVCFACICLHLQTQ